MPQALAVHAAHAAGRRGAISCMVPIVGQPSRCPDCGALRVALRHEASDGGHLLWATCWLLARSRWVGYWHRAAVLVSGTEPLCWLLARSQMLVTGREPGVGYWQGARCWLLAGSQVLVTGREPGVGYWRGARVLVTGGEPGVDSPCCPPALPPWRPPAGDTAVPRQSAAPRPRN